MGAFMTIRDIINRVYREHHRYTGDGKPNEPTGAPLPVGDPQSGVHSPKKADLREAFGDAGDVIDDAVEVAEIALGLYLGELASDPAFGYAGAALTGGEWYVQPTGTQRVYSNISGWANAPQGPSGADGGDGAGADAFFPTVTALGADNNAVVGYAASGASTIVDAGDVVQAGPFFYTVAVSGDASPHITTAGGVKLKQIPGTGGFNALAFGAVGNGTADDTAALTRWATNGGEGIWPNGSYRITAGLDLSNFMSLNPRNVWVTADFDTGTAITFAAEAGERIQRRTFGGSDGCIQVYWATRDWTKFRRAFFVRNAYNCTFGMGWLNATVGAEFNGNLTGCVHNDVYLRECWNHMLGIRCSSATSAGWCNSNRFHGGFFYGTSTAGMQTAGLYSVSTHILVDSSPYLNNGNKFMDPSLEWIGPDFVLYLVGGLKNYIRPMYAELNTSIEDPTARVGAWAIDYGTENETDIMASPYFSGFDALNVSGSRVKADGATRPIVRGRIAHYDLGITGVQYYQNQRDDRPTMRLRNLGAGAALWTERTNDGAHLVVRTNTTTVGSITVADTTTSFNTTSDERLKDFGAYSLSEGSVIDGLSAILAPFSWKAGGGKSYGVSAQAAHAILPAMATPGWGEPGDEDFQPWGVDWSKAVPHLIAYVKTLEQRIAALESLNS